MSLIGSISSRRFLICDSTNHPPLSLLPSTSVHATHPCPCPNGIRRSSRLIHSGHYCNSLTNFNLLAYLVISSAPQRPVHIAPTHLLDAFGYPLAPNSKFPLLPHHPDCRFPLPSLRPRQKVGLMGNSPSPLHPHDPSSPPYDASLRLTTPLGPIRAY